VGARIGALLLALASVVVGQAPAAASQADDYASAIHRTLTLVQFAERGDAPSLQQAIVTLEEAPGPTQPEILRDLRAVPPDLLDADMRLQALDSALQARIDAPDPQNASRQLNAVLAMPRYAGVTTGPGLFQQVLTNILKAIGSVLRWLGIGNLHLNVPLWAWLALALLVLLGLVIWVLRATVAGGRRDSVPPRSVATTRPSADFFHDADRLAATGDYLAAIRALAGGVAVKLSGERAWDRSPFTVRELFARSNDPEGLRILLRTFEEASYANREPDRATYVQAAEAAQPFRGTAA
jgi:hypothetical protein